MITISETLKYEKSVPYNDGQVIVSNAKQSCKAYPAGIADAVGTILGLSKEDYKLSYQRPIKIVSTGVYEAVEHFSPYEVSFLNEASFWTLGVREPPVADKLHRIRAYFRGLDRAYKMPPFDESSIDRILTQKPIFQIRSPEKGPKSYCAINLDNRLELCIDEMGTPERIGVTILHELLHAHLLLTTGNMHGDGSHVPKFSHDKTGYSMHQYIDRYAIKLLKESSHLITYFLHAWRIGPSQNEWFQNIGWHQIKDKQIWKGAIKEAKKWMHHKS